MSASADVDAPEIVLEALDLEKRFGGRSGRFSGDAEPVRAVDGVSLDVRRGETLAIVGESGCGKSTLARLLLRLIEPSAGSVRYRGTDLGRARPGELRALRKDLQFVFQDPFSSLNPRMSVGALVGEPLALHRGLGRAERRARVAELLGKVGLRPEHAARYPHEFSGGQRQRIGIARALASEPVLLVGDEPVSALDVSVQAQIVNLLEGLKAELGLTLVIISHDLAVVRHVADRVAVMYRGRVVELAAADALFAAPRHPYTRALIEAVPAAVPRDPAEPRAATSARVEDAPGAPIGSGCRFRARCPRADAECEAVEPALLAPGGDADRPASPTAPRTAPPTASRAASRAAHEHRVACHHWRDTPPVAPRPDPASSRTAAAARRFELYRERSAPAVPPSPSQDPVA